jgi:hypothetical protein
MGMVDVGFWIGLVLLVVPSFVAGWIARSWLEAERRRAREARISQGWVTVIEHEYTPRHMAKETTDDR